MRFLLLVAFALSALGGEVGIYLESPGAQGSAWLSHGWEVFGGSLNGRVDLGLLPLGFRRAGLSFGLAGDVFGTKAELGILGSGRMDLFLSGSFSWNAPADLLPLLLHLETKQGFLDILGGPTWIGIAWATLRADLGELWAELNLSGPDPWEGEAQLGWNDFVSITLARVARLELSTSEGPLTLASTMALGPQPGHTHTLAWKQGAFSARLNLGTKAERWVGYLAIQETTADLVIDLVLGWEGGKLNLASVKATFQL